MPRLGELRRLHTAATRRLRPRREPARGWQSAGTVPVSPFHHSASPLGHLTVPGELCLVAVTIPGLSPNC